MRCVVDRQRLPCNGHAPLQVNPRLHITQVAMDRSEQGADHRGNHCGSIYKIEKEKCCPRCEVAEFVHAKVLDGDPERAQSSSHQSTFNEENEGLEKVWANVWTCSSTFLRAGGLLLLVRRDGYLSSGSPVHPSTPKRLSESSKLPRGGVAEVHIGLGQVLSRHDYVCHDCALRSDRARIGLQKIRSTWVNSRQGKERQRRREENSFRDEGGLGIDPKNYFGGDLFGDHLFRGGGRVKEVVHRKNEVPVPNMTDLLLIAGRAFGSEAINKRFTRSH